MLDYARAPAGRSKATALGDEQTQRLQLGVIQFYSYSKWPLPTQDAAGVDRSFERIYKSA
jgi:hypothetical protein